MADSPLDEVIKIAAMIVLETPKGDQYTPTARIDRELITRLRAALVAAGVDMDAVEKNYRRLQREAKNGNRGKL
jgi:hypothetical protein